MRTPIITKLVSIALRAVANPYSSAKGNVLVYLIVVIFQNIRSQVKLFLLIAVLLLLYALGKQMHLSSLIIILIFGLLIANRDISFAFSTCRNFDKRP